jgi:mannose-6-phosphate isomerase-like protein (cupin superfamily)
VTVSRSARAEVPAYRTLDGSEIRELMHPSQYAARNQSLAEALVEPGGRTQAHRHRATEELYHILAGAGIMRLDGERFEVRPGDTVLIPPGSVHCIENPGVEALRFLCCCAPAYRHEDTELVDA